jgi:hypothetical protein
MISLNLSIENQTLTTFLESSAKMTVEEPMDYRQKQAAPVWNHYLMSALQQMGFNQLKTAECLDSYTLL